MAIIAPNSLKIPDDDIVRIYRENKQGDWAKQVNFLARLNGASEMDIVSVLIRRSSDLGAAARPVRTGPSTFGFVLPTPSPRAFDQVVLKRIEVARQKVEAAISDLQSTLRTLDTIAEGIVENGKQNVRQR